MDIETAQLLEALKRTGQRLAATEAGIPSIRLLLVGGLAGALARSLPPERSTSDCDVMDVSPPDHWDTVQRVAIEVGRELGLKASWLNQDCRMYEAYMPTGWKSRCSRIEVFGKLEVHVVHRSDLVVAKIMSAPKRVQDREDLQHLKPTVEELGMAERHIDRLESESLDGETFERQRTFVAIMRQSDDNDK